MGVYGCVWVRDRGSARACRPLSTATLVDLPGDEGNKRTQLTGTLARGTVSSCTLQHSLICGVELGAHGLHSGTGRVKKGKGGADVILDR